MSSGSSSPFSSAKSLSLSDPQQTGSGLSRTASLPRTPTSPSLPPSQKVPRSPTSPPPLPLPPSVSAVSAVSVTAASSSSGIHASDPATGTATKRKAEEITIQTPLRIAPFSLNKQKVATFLEDFIEYFFQALRMKDTCYEETLPYSVLRKSSEVAKHIESYIQNSLMAFFHYFRTKNSKVQQSIVVSKGSTRFSQNKFKSEEKFIRSREAVLKNKPENIICDSMHKNKVQRTAAATAVSSGHA
jgi:hypothetical protein